ncbi:MAG: UDP-N-acetylmuramate dehydrogenase [Ilumatobacter sp.]|nr:UDP-N-acetylmuramate dehydrogenase [Ilumatobacter sp.]
MAVDAVQRVLQRLQGCSRPDVPLAPFTTYRVGGPAAVLAEPRTVEELLAVGQAARATGLPVLLVGRGSNLLVADEGFPGIAVSLAHCDGAADRIEVDGTTVTVGAAVALPVLARRTVAAGLTGLEWAVGVPGSVGGAVRMNAGGHGSDVAATLAAADVVDLRDGRRASVPAVRLGLRFRASDLADEQVVVAATFLLQPGTVAEGEAQLAEIVRWRREHQPGGQNAGSVFVNPIPGELAAGQLVDRLGLRGFRIGTAHVSEKHANFIQSTDGGTAADVRAVIEHVRAAVLDATGIRLRSEIRLVGFPDVPAEDRPGVEW